VRAVKNIGTSSRQSCKYIASSIKYTTIMVRNCESNDIDFVPYTQHLKHASQKSQTPPPEPWPYLVLNLFLLRMKIPMASRIFPPTSIIATPCSYSSYSLQTLCKLSVNTTKRLRDSKEFKRP